MVAQGAFSGIFLSVGNIAHLQSFFQPCDGGKGPDFADKRPEHNCRAEEEKERMSKRNFNRIDFSGYGDEWLAMAKYNKK